MIGGVTEFKSGRYFTKFVDDEDEITYVNERPESIGYNVIKPKNMQIHYEQRPDFPIIPLRLGVLSEENGEYGGSYEDDGSYDLRSYIYI